MSRHPRAGAVMAMLLVMVLAMVLPELTADPAAHAADELTIQLVHQDLALPPDEPLVIQFHPSTPLGDATVRVVAHTPVADQEKLRQAIDHQLTGPIDRVDVDMTAAVIDEAGNVKITVPTETNASTESALRLSDPGLYPLVVEIRSVDGTVATSLVTFVDRLAVDDEATPGFVSVALLSTIIAPPTLPGDDSPVPADVAAQVAELGRYPAGLPLSLSISPGLLDRLDNQSMTALSAAMFNGVVLSQPLVPLDPSAAAAAGLEELFTEFLVDGENAVTDTGKLPHTDRSVWFAPQGITDAGATLLRKLGVKLLVVPSDVYLAADGNFGQLTDYSQLYQSVLAEAPDVSSGADAEGIECGSASASCLPTAVIDPALAARLSDPSLTDEQAALYTAADLVVYRDFFAQRLSSDRHGLVLGVDGVGVANGNRVGRAVDLAESTGAARFITLDELEQSSEQWIVDGHPLELRLPQPTPIDLNPRQGVLDVLSLEAATVSSMLVTDLGRDELWTRTIRTLYSSSITDEQVDVAEAGLKDAMATIRGCVEPPSSLTFTLSGRSTNLPLRLINRCTEQVKVVINLSAAAAKMEFPQNDLTVILDPGSNEYRIPVTARTNGTFDITLKVLTPTGRVEITSAAKLRARVNALTGLPQVITGAGLLILLTWWARNQRRSRRAKRAAAAMTAMTGHPATG